MTNLLPPIMTGIRHESLHTGKAAAKSFTLHCSLFTFSEVVPGRLELPTSTLSVWRSNQLSYRTLSSVRGGASAQPHTFSISINISSKKRRARKRTFLTRIVTAEANHSLFTSHYPLSWPSSPERRCSSRTFRYGYLVTT